MLVTGGFIPKVAAVIAMLLMDVPGGAVILMSGMAASMTCVARGAF